MTTQEMKRCEELPRLIVEQEEDTTNGNLSSTQVMGAPLKTKVPERCQVRNKKENAYRFTCSGCDKFYSVHQSLRYHIRRKHFNLKGKIPNCEIKEVNQVWIERVLNTDALMEIKKTGQNTLVMKKLANVSIEIDRIDNFIDLSHLYPSKYKKNN